MKEGEDSPGGFSCQIPLWRHNNAYPACVDDSTGSGKFPVRRVSSQASPCPLALALSPSGAPYTQLPQSQMPTDQLPCALIASLSEVPGDGTCILQPFVCGFRMMSSKDLQARLSSLSSTSCGMGCMLSVRWQRVGVCGLPVQEASVWPGLPAQVGVDGSPNVWGASWECQRKAPGGES